MGAQRTAYAGSIKEPVNNRKISGLYVPFWLYDYKAEDRMIADAEK